MTVTFLPRPICLPCTVEANMALRRSQGGTCREHGELGTKLGCAGRAWAAVLTSGWMQGLWVRKPVLTLPSPRRQRLNFCSSRRFLHILWL